MGPARGRPANTPGRADDCRATARRSELGPAGGLACEAHGAIFPFVGRTRVASGRCCADLGLARHSGVSVGQCADPA
ncbi:MAG: hypothetical protein PVS3B2_08610 [Candidatus Dormibacteraceae bacterium]